MLKITTYSPPSGESLLALHACLQPPIYRDPRSKAWLQRVFEGDWAAIPEKLSFSEAIDLGYVIDGHALSSRLFGGGFAEEELFFRSALRHVLDGGKWEGNAVELWLLLFIAQRECTHTSLHMEPGVVPALDKLVLSLRSALQSLPPLPADST